MTEIVLGIVIFALFIIGVVGINKYISKNHIEKIVENGGYMFEEYQQKYQKQQDLEENKEIFGEKEGEKFYQVMAELKRLNEKTDKILKISTFFFYLTLISVVIVLISYANLYNTIIK